MSRSSLNVDSKVDQKGVARFSLSPSGPASFTGSRNTAVSRTARKPHPERTGRGQAAVRGCRGPAHAHGFPASPSGLQPRWLPLGLLCLQGPLISPSLLVNSYASFNTWLGYHLPIRAALEPNFPRRCSYLSTDNFVQNTRPLKF